MDFSPPDPQSVTSLAPHLQSQPQTRRVWLLDNDQQPEASPELQATGVFDDDVLGNQSCVQQELPFSRLYQDT